MTTKQFFEMQLACNVTMSELLDIKDALYIAERYYTNKNHVNIAKSLDMLYDKLTKIQEHYEQMCK